MLDSKNRPHHSHPSLLPLRVELILAQRGVPLRPASQVVSVDERLAVELIGRMKLHYDKPLTFINSKNDSTVNIFEHLEIISIHA